MEQCEVENGSRSACRTMARLYFAGVEIFGGKKRAVEMWEAGLEELLREELESGDEDFTEFEIE